MSDTTRLRALTEAGLLHPNPDAVLAPLFTGGSGFFLAPDKVQVKYEMLRARLVEGMPVIGSCCSTRLFAGSVLSGGGGVRSVGDGGAGRRAARPARPGQAAPGDRGLHPRRHRVGGADRRTGRRPVRGAVAPAHHRAGTRPVSARSFWPPVRGGAGRLRNTARARARASRAAGGSGRGPVRPPRPGRVDRVAGRRAGVRRRTRSPPPVRPGHRTRIHGWRRWPRVMSSCSTSPPAGSSRRACRCGGCGEGGAVCAGVHRAASRPRHHRLAAAAAARTHRRRR